METQTFTLLLCLAAIVASGSLLRALAWFIYSGLPMFGPSWAALRVYPVIPVPTAPWQPIGPQLGLASIGAVRAAGVDLSVLDARADPAMLPVPSAQDDVTL
jgi:hypothetical protein